jgi:ferrochelatase
MAFRTSISQLTKSASRSTISKLTSTPTTALWQRGSADQLRSFATPVPPVTQDATGSKGPTAMVFMNMGGPETTDKVGDFLSRLFVRQHAPFIYNILTFTYRQMAI